MGKKKGACGSGGLREGRQVGGGGGMQSPDIIFKSDTAKHFKAGNNGECV